MVKLFVIYTCICFMHQSKCDGILILSHISEQATYLERTHSRDGVRCCVTLRAERFNPGMIRLAFFLTVINSILEEQLCVQMSLACNQQTRMCTVDWSLVEIVHEKYHVTFRVMSDVFVCVHAWCMCVSQGV